MGRVLQKRCPPEVVTDGLWRKPVPAELLISDLKLVLTHDRWAALAAVALTLASCTQPL